MACTACQLGRRPAEVMTKPARCVLLSVDCTELVAAGASADDAPSPPPPAVGPITAAGCTGHSVTVDRRVTTPLPARPRSASCAGQSPAIPDNMHRSWVLRQHNTGPEAPTYRRPAARYPAFQSHT